MGPLSLLPVLHSSLQEPHSPVLRYKLTSIRTEGGFLVDSALSL